jgi:heme exporter protein C
MSTPTPPPPSPGASRAERWLGILALILALVLLAAGLRWSPAERALQEYVRILYVHVGAAWTAYLAYLVTAIGSVAYLGSRRRAWDRLAVSSAELGVVLTAATLATGSLWGKAAQGWWWRWDDPRLVITLFMFFLYTGYLILRQYTDGERRATLSAVLAIVGIPVMVLNHFAVTLWNRYHPRAIVGRPEGPAIEGDAILYTLVLSVAAFTVIYAYLAISRMRLEAERDAVEAAGWEG